MNKDTFWGKVVRDVKEELPPDDADDFRKPENLEYWRECLVHFKKDLERQAASRKSIFHKVKSEAWGNKAVYKACDVDIASSEYYKWKASVQPILKSLENKIREVNHLIKEQRKQKSKYFHQLWRLINMAEVLIPADCEWQKELKKIREENQNV